MAARNKEKYTNALLYFIAECGNEKLGIMKLNKLFYYLDFISFRDRNKSVTGETYMRLPKGPFAASLDGEIIASAKKKGLIMHKEDESEKYGRRNRFQALQPCDLSVFDEYEQTLLKKLCETFRDWSTDQMVAQTHSEAPWVFSSPSKPLDYKNADDIEFFTPSAVV
jgi:uncharacterized phage-associated protein